MRPELFVEADPFQRLRKTAVGPGEPKITTFVGTLDGYAAGTLWKEEEGWSRGLREVVT
jgi:hypothetical protein